MHKISNNLSETAGYVNLERLTFLVDGVFAITLTLLVLELRLPETIETSFGASLLGLLPRLYIYFIAFYSIANYWVVHQRTFRHITKMDTPLLWLTLLALLFITLIPATTALVGRFPTEKLAMACFSANSLLQALVNWIFWRYVLKHQPNFSSQSDPRLLAISAQVWLMIAFGWLVSIFLGYVNVFIAFLSWVLWPNIAALWANRKRQNVVMARS